MSVLDAVAVDIEETDSDGVLTWRYQSLRRAGYTAGVAAELARSRTVDLHRAIELLERGCEPALARRILL